MKSQEGDQLKSKNVILATGSNRQVFEYLGSLGLNVIPPVPSLFTFKVKDKLLDDMQGTSFEGSVDIICERS